MLSKNERKQRKSGSGISISINGAEWEEAEDDEQKPRSDPWDQQILTVQDVSQAGYVAIKAKNGGSFPHHDLKSKPAAPEVKPPKFYPADDVKKQIPNHRKPKPTKLRASITPGTVLIILAGRFMGKRVVFLNQLSSGLLLFTGPFKVNGVPLRRVNQAYVIATSTKVGISGVDVQKYDDKYFAKETKRKKKTGEGEFFEAEKEETKSLPQDKKDDQKAVDAQLIKCIEAVPDLKAYLAARFSLRSDMKPH